MKPFCKWDPFETASQSINNGDNILDKSLNKTLDAVDSPQMVIAKRKASTANCIRNVLVCCFYILCFVIVPLWLPAYIVTVKHKKCILQGYYVCMY